MAPRNPLELNGAGFEPGRKPPVTDHIAQLREKKDERGRSCFDGEERGTYAGDTTPLINEKRPSL